MNRFDAAKIPLLTNCNRVERLYPGGALLDAWQGIKPETDGNLSEEFLVSTVEYLGPGTPKNKGVSKVLLPDKEAADLRAWIAQDPADLLGEQYASLCEGHLGVLVRVGDSTKRLVIQCHPTTQKAKSLLGIPFGKTEAWYIAKTRAGGESCVYCGFQKGVTRARWAQLLESQDVSGMIACLHRIPVQEGDFILVDAGMPHAMGGGNLFVELHEPCDYTIRMERNYLDRTLSDDEMHYGLGFDALLDFFEYDTFAQEEIRGKCLMRPSLKQEQAGGRLFEGITYQNTKAFRADKLSLCGEFRLDACDSHFLMIAVKKDVTLRFESGSLVIPQGRAAFVPAGAGALLTEGCGDVILAYPFQTEQENGGV